MHVEAIIQKLLPTIHNTRKKSLVPVIDAILKRKTLKLTELGRNLEIKGKERAGIRRIDRLLSNRFYQHAAIGIYQAMINSIIGPQHQAPDIIVDWSSIPNSALYANGGEHCLLRAAIASSGRSITLYEEVHPKKKENDPMIHENFLHRLKSLLPKGCKPCIITDAGFKNPWFRSVTSLGWDYIGRLRGLVKYGNHGVFTPVSELHVKASSQAKALGSFAIAKTNPMQTHMYLYKGKPKGRHKCTKTKKRSSSAYSNKYSKGRKEPWVLASSINTSNARRIVNKYKRRMTIEEAFRDVKSPAHGLALRENKTVRPERYTVWLMLAALATVVAWVLGWAAERDGLHYDFQSNTCKTRRVISLFYLGCQIVRKNIRLRLPDKLDALLIEESA